MCIAFDDRCVHCIYSLLDMIWPTVKPADIVWNQANASGMLPRILSWPQTLVVVETEQRPGPILRHWQASCAITNPRMRGPQGC